MNTITLHLICIFLGIISACPVLLIKTYISNSNFNLFGLIGLLMFFYGIADLTFYYLIKNDISIVKFYPIVKLIEICIPVLIGIFYYKKKFKIINYIGLVLAFISIILIGR